jgi:hypothetical protein
MSTISGPGQFALAAALHSPDDANLIASSIAAGGLTPTAVVAALTDNSGGATADGTIGVVTIPDALTDSSGGTGSTTLASISDTATKNAIASLAAQHAKVITAITANRDAIKELSTKLNAILTSLKNGNVMASS